MKIVLYLFMLTACFTAQGQDYCKRVKKEVSEDKKSFSYTSPFDQFTMSSIHVSRSINIDPDYPSDNFYIIFRILGTLDSIYTKNAEGEQEEKEERKIVVEFDDRSNITDELIQVSHDVTDDKLQAVRYVYYPLTDLNIKDFTTKKIVKFNLAGYEKTVPSDTAVAVQHYVQCIKDAR